MTYNSGNGNFASSNITIGAPSNGFASRGKANHIKRLSVAPPNKISSIPEDHANSAQLPRTARSHLLAGLRTAPKTPAAVPASAPYHQTQHRAGFDASSYYAMNNNNARFGYDMPQTAALPGFGGNIQYQQQFDFNSQGMYQGYANADQILAQQALNLGYGDYDGIDTQFYDELLQTNLYLAQRKQQLQQQLMNVTAAAQQQLQNMNLNSGSPPTPVSPPANGYGQQQQSFFAANQTAFSPIEATHTGFAPIRRSTSRSPPKTNEANTVTASAPTATTSSNTPQSPGYRRAGEHPVRQPRGPPPLEELTAKPTSKFEGSKNFAARQRRRAVHSLVRAGLERRSALGQGPMEEFVY